MVSHKAERQARMMMPAYWRDSFTMMNNFRISGAKLNISFKIETYL